MCRRIGFRPEATYFKPAGIPLRMLDETGITFEELEAIRLKDTLGMDQSTAAKEMRVSQPTFNRTLMEARKKIAGALVEGKAIRIEGGTFKFLKEKKKEGKD